MLHVYDCRLENSTVPKKTLDASGLRLNAFLQVVQKTFAVPSRETFVLVTTDRTVVTRENFEELQNGCTLYLLRDEEQALPAATKEDINFVPHYNTLIESGTYEYFAEGQKSLPCALAELVDNALSATAKNTEVRRIEIRMLFDKVFGKPAVIVLDNGRGMTSKQLNNWAVYRLSKFVRENSTFESEKEEYVRPAPVPRSLNSDISFFGVGGKRAVFHIGDSVRMISKPTGFQDVHELVLSKEEFKKKELNKEDVYKGTILNRKPGDSSHITDNERFLHDVIAEEPGKESFTAVVITGVSTKNIDFLKQDFDDWARELAHIYHYYIHGVDGNCSSTGSQRSDELPKIDIVVTLQEKPPKISRVMNLREVEDDMQTLYINSAVNTFEFRATTSDGGTAEGVLRYHPFLYDRETYPKDPYMAQAPVDDDDDDDNNENESGNLNQARGKRDIFECFWNGRLIPYTTVSEFDWCSRPVKGATLPAECYSRFSGVLFTDDKFLVNASKQKFMDLELKLKSKDTIFTPVVNAQKTPKRGNIQKEFVQWLQYCHQKCDKQVKFLGYIKTVTRTDLLIKKQQHPWATFSSIELDGKTYKAGQLVKSQKTVPILYGTVVRFLLYGNHDGDVYATGGQVEIRREPDALYDNFTKLIPISKLDRTATDKLIKKNIDNDMDKLPEELMVDWPDSNAWKQNDVCPAGSPLGPLKVEILNRKGVSISSKIHTGQGLGIKLSILLSVVHHGPEGDTEVTNLVAPYISNIVGHWFKRIETLNSLGKYTLKLNTTRDAGATVYGGRQLPSYVLKFSIKEGNAETFTVGTMSSTLCVGVPFNIPLQIKDGYNHPTTPPKLQPVLTCSGLEITYHSVSCSGTTLTIKGVKAKGKVQNYQQSKSYDLNVTLPGLKNDTQTIKISLLPGAPHSLHVKPDTNPVKVENGNQASFKVEVHDEAGNVTANPKQIVRCQVSGLPTVEADCSSTGAGQLETKPINLSITNGEPQMLDAKFDMPNQKKVATVVLELKVMPSSRVSRMELFFQGEEKCVLRDKEKIQWQAGGLLQNLYYKLYDESGMEVSVNTEMASSIKVNWTPEVSRRGLVKGRLPDVQVPPHVSEERFYQVSYQDLSVSSCFTIVPCPDEPARLKATLPQNTLKLGETLLEHIILELVDQYDNVTNKLIPASGSSITVEAEGLDKSNITFKWQESSSSVAVTGVRFSSGSLGPREICFNYSDFTERAIVKLTAGIPSQLIMISKPEQPLQILNGHGIPTPFLVQLCDEWGNPSPDQRVVVEIKSSPQTLKVSTNVISQPVDTEGKASFTVNSVKGTKGYYQLEFIGSFNKNPIPGPSVQLTVIPDPNNPVQLQVNYDTSASFCAGDTFPVFSVMVVSEEGSPITAFNPAELSMLLWKGVTQPQNSLVTKLKCSKPMENETKDCFHFRDKVIPERAGQYTIQFSMRSLRSIPISITVVANQPVKLGPDSQPPTPVVSISTDISSRILVENMTLKIMDKFGNSAGQDLNGTVVASIRCLDDEQSRSVPLFEGKTSDVQIPLNKGSTHINTLAIMENSPGENGSRYVVVFKAEVPTTSLVSFELPFHFYNDVENQRKMSELSRKKDELSATLAQYEETRCSFNQLMEMLSAQVQDTSKKEAALKDELNRKNVKVPHSVAIQDIVKLLTDKQAEIEMIENMPRRVCCISNNYNGQDVIGMVGHLALIENDDAARVISWHLGGDMDCVITRTTAAAQRIHRNSGGNQQVMALDSIFVQQADRSLPHIRNGYKLFDPPGDPVYAKDLLIFPHEQQSCETVFKNLLGTTILMRDLESATDYRKKVVEKRIQCPTILTLQGDRVSSRGKFGGAQNRAPPIQRLKVFGAPLPQHYFILLEQKELLCQYHAAVLKRQTAEMDWTRHWKSPDMAQKQQELEEIKKQLADIDEQLASVRRSKRGPEDAGEPSGIKKKRQRQRCP